MPDDPATATPARTAPTADAARAHRAAVWRYLRVLGAAPQEADDLVQETFVVLLRTPFADRGPAAMRTWLRSTARQLFFAACRTTNRAPVRIDTDAVTQALDDYERDDDGAGYRAALRSCLEILPARQRELLELQVIDSASPARLATAAGLTAEGTQSLLRRVKDALRNCVKRRLA